MGNEQRDALAKVLDSISIFRDPGEKRDWPTRKADAVIADGWIKTRTIATVEQLKGLHAGTLLREPDGDVWSIDGSTDRLFLIYDGADTTYDDHELILPATVLYEPQS